MKRDTFMRRTSAGEMKFTFFFFLFVTILLFMIWHWIATLAHASASPASNINYSLRAESIEKSAIADTYVASGKPEQRRGNADGLWVGYSESDDFKKERTLIQFDISEIPAGSHVESAILSLYLGIATPGDGNMNITAQRIISNWNENINWNEYANLVIDGTQTASADVSVSKGWYDWDLTVLLKKQLEDSSNSGKFGVLLIGNETLGQHERGFWSKDCAPDDCGSPPGLRPILRITYQEPTPTPVPTPTPTPGINAELQNDPNNSRSPIKVGDSIKYTIVYENTGISDLTDVKIDAPVPDHTKFVPGETLPSLPWPIDKIEKNETGEISYTVKRIDDDDADAPIFNEGVIITWKYPGGEGEMNTNAVVNNFNPSEYLYLPAIFKEGSGPQ